jgi:hypothetical protein
MIPLPNHYLSGDVAKLLRVSRSRVHQIAATGALGHVERVGWAKLFSRRSVHAYLSAARIPSVKPGRPKNAILGNK